MAPPNWWLHASRINVNILSGPLTCKKTQTFLLYIWRHKHPYHSLHTNNVTSAVIEYTLQCLLGKSDKYILITHSIMQYTIFSCRCHKNIFQVNSESCANHSHGVNTTPKIRFKQISRISLY